MKTKIKVEVTISGRNLTAEEYWNEIKALQKLLGADVEVEIKEYCGGNTPKEYCGGNTPVVKKREETR